MRYSLAGKGRQCIGTHTIIFINIFITFSEIFPCLSYVRLRFDRFGQMDLISFNYYIFDRHDRFTALRNRRTSHDPNSFTILEYELYPISSINNFITSDNSTLIATFYRIPIHCRVIKAWQTKCSIIVRGDCPTQTLFDRNNFTR